jgi:TetR/AcrR family transcriptional repressor of nem operon
VRITKEQKQENYDRILSIASEMFRERGYDGVGVAELMERAGLTHGGFYNHFRSKEDLVAKATLRSFREIGERYANLDTLTTIDLYLSREHRDNRATGCPATALICEAARQTDETRATFGAGIEALLGSLEQSMAHNGGAGTDTRAAAISVLAQAVGAVVLSRACPDDSSLADQILTACRLDCRGAVSGGSREN